MQIHSQVKFEKGYYISDDNIRTECFMRNTDHFSNPTSFLFKINEGDSNTSIGDLSSVKEFGIDNVMKFERATLEVDMSDFDLKYMGKNREPEWKERTLFLKVLIEGSATLYEYRDVNFKRYFVKINNSPIQQLIYKKYFQDPPNYIKIAENKDFQKQLWTNLRNSDFNLDKVLKMDYSKQDLTEYFIEYNTSNDNSFEDYYSSKSRGSVNFKIQGGLNFTGLKNTDNGDVKVEYNGNKYYLKYGGELEYVAAFNRNKWAGFFEYSHQSYDYDFAVTRRNSNSGATFEITERDSNYINQNLWSVGIRHYMYLNADSSIYLDAGLFGRLGMGYSHQHKYSIAFIKNNIQSFASYSVVLSYTVFNYNKQK
jgi:hypothetical protein